MNKKISKNMFPYIKKVCDRDGITLSEVENYNDTYRIFNLNIKNSRFTEVLEDALCLKQQEELNSNIPVYSLRTVKNAQKLHNLMKLNDKKTFQILECDKEAYLNIFL